MKCDRSPAPRGRTIDSIEVAEFESQADLKDWLDMNAPAFATKTEAN
jgi:hypothetical protein